MRTSYSSQYDSSVVIIENNDTAYDVIEFAKHHGALFDDGEDVCIVVDFDSPSRSVGPELYTEKALIRSWNQK